MDPLAKRDLLHGDGNASKIDAAAAALIAGGRAGEAVDFVEITKNPSLLSKLEADAIARGSSWLLGQVERIRGAKASPEQWSQLAAGAMTAQRFTDAVRALQAAGRPEDAEAARLAHCPGYDPFKPLGK